jgi:transcriptional regulator with XRE-family HTH domain
MKKRDSRPAPTRVDFKLADAVLARARDLRMARGWSRERLAMEAGLSPDAIARIERGERNPRLETLERIGAAVGVPLPKFVDFGEPPTLPQSRGLEVRARSLQRMLDQLDPGLAKVVITLIRSLAKVGRKPTRLLVR